MEYIKVDLSTEDAALQKSGWSTGAEKTKTFQVAEFVNKNFPDEKCVNLFRDKSVFTSFQHYIMAWKVSRWPGKFLGSLISFQAACKAPRLPRKFPDDLESFHLA